MWQHLLFRLEQQANESEPEVRAGALLRIARVQTALELAKARATFEAALEQIQSIPGREQSSFLEEAQIVAAAVAPDLVSRRQPNGRSRPRHFQNDSVVRTMLEHGHVDAAFDFVVRNDGDSEAFPFSSLFTLLPKLGDEERQRGVFRKAVEAGRRDLGHMFVTLFRSYWHLLPKQEAQEIVRDLVKSVEERSDKPITATYDPERTVVIFSEREHTLFQLLDVLRKVDNDLAESLIARYQQLGEAARHYPNGMRSIADEATKRKPEAPAGSGGGVGYAFVGDPKDFPAARALMDATRNGEFEQSMAYAAQKYGADASPTDPNRTPKYFWPSTAAFRQVMYSVGKRNGEVASELLDQIHDPDVRLFAEIEFVAALAGLPEFQSVQRQYRPRTADRAKIQFDRGPLMRSIRCPKCQWVPAEGNIWFCRCGHAWNTFQTRGVCPSCKFKWEETVCHGCGEISVHKVWYVAG